MRKTLSSFENINRGEAADEELQAAIGELKKLHPDWDEAYAAEVARISIHSRNHDAKQNRLHLEEDVRDPMLK